MKGWVHWSLMMSAVIFAYPLLFPGWTYAYVYGQVGSSPYPTDGTVTFIAYIKERGDSQILTEDNFQSGIGVDRGYQSQYFIVKWENFEDLPTTGDTLVVLFTGIGAQQGKSGAIEDSLDTGAPQQNFGQSSWEESPKHPAVPTGLTAKNILPGTVDLFWHPSPPKNGFLSYRIYRSSMLSGAENGASDGRYTRIAQGITDTTYQDTTAVNLSEGSDNWYIVVAADSVDPDTTYLSGHSEEEWIDAALPVQLTAFTATGGEKKVTLEWITESEWDNQGFHLYRREEAGEVFERITQELIPGAGNSCEPRVYSWEDRRVENGQTYWYQLECVDLHGGIQRYGPVSATPMEVLPQTYRLFQNYPNPFNPQTWISYQLPEFGPVTVKIYNVKGQLVNTLVDSEQAPGYYRVRWSGRDLHGTPAASGVYFCQMKSGPFTQITKMVLLK